MKAFFNNVSFTPRFPSVSRLTDIIYSAIKIFKEHSSKSHDS